MKIGIIDADLMWSGKKSKSNFPNIACMKISGYHKKRGDEVSWYQGIERYDRVYVSKVFSSTPVSGEIIQADEVVYGGSGFSIKLIDGKEVWKEPDSKIYQGTYMNVLPYDIEHSMPDYSLYPTIKDTAYGFLTRGCPRGCSFCHVEAKEGRRSYKVADLSEFWNGQKNIVLCDPNILACKEWKDLLKQLEESKAWIDINQGIDARLMTEEKAIALSKLKLKEVHFAWDRYQDKDSVLRGLKIYAEHNKKIHNHNSIVFTIVNFDTTIEQDLERIYTLRELGFWAYVMIYDKEHCNQIYKSLQRWVNNRLIFAKCKRFEDYDRKKAKE